AALAGRRPLHTSIAPAGTSGVAYYPMLAESLTAMALQAADLTTAGGDVLVIDGRATAAGEPLASAIRGLLPGRAVSAGRGVPLRTPTVRYGLVDAIRQSGMTAPDVVLLVAREDDEDRLHPLGRNLCDALPDALDELAITPTVITSICTTTRDGWYRIGAGYD